MPQPGGDIVRERPARIVPREQPPRRAEDQDAALDRGRDRRRARLEPAPFQPQPHERLLHRDRPPQTVVSMPLDLPPRAHGGAIRLVVELLDKAVDGLQGR